VGPPHARRGIMYAPLARKFPGPRAAARFSPTWRARPTSTAVIPMTELEAVVGELREHDGVEHVLLVGRDGLLVYQSGTGEIDGETVAALAPGLVWSCTSLGEAAVQGGFVTAVMEWTDGVGIVADLSSEVLLAVLLRPETGFAPLLHTIRARRDRLAELVG
jgi:predicted regulator of Ras-like GTPase activity (Roadblock/LC7/MglB family)